MIHENVDITYIEWPMDWHEASCYMNGDILCTIQLTRVDL